MRNTFVTPGTGPGVDAGLAVTNGWPHRMLNDQMAHNHPVQEALGDREKVRKHLREVHNVTSPSASSVGTHVALHSAVDLSNGHALDPDNWLAHKDGINAFASSRASAIELAAIGHWVGLGRGKGWKFVGASGVSTPVSDHEKAVYDAHVASGHPHVEALSRTLAGRSEASIRAHDTASATAKATAASHEDLVRNNAASRDAQLSHQQLLDNRAAARKQYPQGHPERLKAEKAVRDSRKSDEYRGNKVATGGRDPMSGTPGSKAVDDTAKKLSDAKKDPAFYEPGEVKEEALPFAPKPNRSIGEAVKRATRKATGGVHPDDITTFGEPTQHVNTIVPNRQQMKWGAPVREEPELRTSLKQGEKYVGLVSTNKRGYGKLAVGNKESDIIGKVGEGKSWKEMHAENVGKSWKEMHAENVEAARNMTASEINARRARSALSAAGHSAVKSHSTRIRGYRNYDPGFEVGPTQAGVSVSHYGGSSLMARNSGRTHEDRIEKYAAALEAKGFAVERTYNDEGQLTSVFIPNAKQGGK
jgi:hypothetical protein